MATDFKTAFPALELNDNLQKIFDRTQVDKVNFAKGKTIVKVYLDCEYIIPKYQIYRLEKEIKSQYFEKDDIEVQVVEHFLLPEKYTLELIIEEYKDSIMEEFRHISNPEHTMLLYSDWATCGDSLKVTIFDGYIPRHSEKNIREHIRKILLEKFDYDVDVTIDFKENTQKKKEEEEKKRLEEAMFDPNYEPDYGSLPSEAAMEVNPQGTPKEEVVKNSEKASKGSLNKGSGKKNEKFSKNRNDNNDSQTQGPRHYKRTDEPGYIYGRTFEEHDYMAIEELKGDIGEVVIHGQICSLEVRELRNKERVLAMFALTDYTDSIMVKLFVASAYREEFEDDFKVGKFIELKGVCMYDTYDKDYNIGSVFGVRNGEDFRTKRMDNAPVKRVELHAHTKMSDMDAVCEAGDLMVTANRWGHKAIAITDHGVVHAFTDAFHTLQKKFKDSPFKVIYGVEAYMVDDLKHTVTRSEGQVIAEQTYVAFDIETTGFSPVKDKIIEIGAVKIKDGEVIDRFNVFVDPQIPIPARITELTSITDAMVAGAETIEVVLPKFLEFSKDCVMVAHNADFDMGFMTQKAKEQGFVFEPTYVDTLGMSRAKLTHLSRFKLDVVAKDLDVVLESHHRAVDDAECCGYIFIKLMERISAQDNVHNLDELEEFSKIGPETIKKMRTNHIIILAANTVGRFNLYKLVSMSHLDYFSRFPRIPKSMLAKYREGLIIGSGCVRGELVSNILRGEPEEEITQIASFYDYLEIQPVENNMSLLREKEPVMKSVEDLQDLNRRIVKLGENLGKPVVATGDVHFLNPEDEVYRRILQYGKNKGNKREQAEAELQPPLYLKTTEEMLNDFEYLGTEKAYEVVVTNSNLIADRIDYITPVRPDKCPPVIENSDKTLRELCYKTAIEQYGDPLPDIVKDRLELELNSIISNGFAVMYIIAQKLVNKSNEDGYLVGSRGSVGSSFVATMSGITEVNPLSPHYYCRKCKYNDFYSEDVKKFAGAAGCDMPDKKCPVCGEPLIKEGFDIPFQTFLGFKGNKEPDIDLNFSGEYQSKAHAYTEVIFGAGQTFRAGTIATLADKTAFGYIKNYYEEKGQNKRVAEINRLVGGCVGVRRSTGQHPGGIIVLPLGEEIYTFTPVQHPANDTTTATVTTHFDYHSIDHNLLKLDILGHDDPTMIRMLQDLTGLDPRTFPLDSPEVMSLFQSTDALKLKDGQPLLNCTLGCLAIPEFGTDFAMQMVIDTKPQHFSDLVRIAGLAHGTNVWLGNAQTLIMEGKATIATAICTRDDIMTYLISMGVESEESFKIMEAVRKGTVAKKKCDNWPQWRQDMIDHGVPDWYIWSCERIEYMFPKAHAAAYVMMAWRIAYCKIFYPLAFYAAYFSIRATGFSYEIMCMGQEKLEKTLMDYWNRKDDLSQKEQDVLKDMRIVQEMYHRGYEFMPIDIYRAKAQRFQIIDGKIMPSFASIDGLGGKAAEALELAAKDGPFVSREDARNRAHISQTVSDKMGELGLFGELPESNQYSLFDLGMLT
ncbi:MAG: PolC-type DNA polymerase III [Lachnospiraceae bacterium]|nr:PolC-type DNA polymerase III [Lachnospiraceae bacterium]